MSDPRFQALADTLLRYSCDLAAGDRLLVEAIDVPHAMTNTLVSTAAEIGAHPVVLLKSLPVQRVLLRAVTPEAMDLVAAGESAIMKEADAYVAVRGNDNVSELSDVPPAKMALYETRWWKPVHLEHRMKTRWVVTRWPSPSMAQLAETSTEAFEEFYFKVTTLDYARMSKAMDPLRELVEATDRVRLVAPGTDLRFSIREIAAIKCDGKRNIPDGEVYTAPVRDSIEGTIRYNTPSLYRGVTHEDVTFRFEKGAIVEASSSQQEALDAVLESDEGARRVGEFAIGLNPHITEPMNDILFDEKIAGSIHFTPGQAYAEADNGNRSTVHWDLVLRMDPRQGGGEIWFDEVLVRKDGRFVLPALEGLNPENLV